MFDKIKNKIPGTHIKQDKYGERMPKIGYIDEKISGDGTEDIDPREIDKIQKRLDPDEWLLMAVRQSRVKPGGAAIITPNTMFVTNKRMLVRNPKKLGFAVDIEEYPYDTITNVKLTKGIFSSSIQITIPGMTEMSKVDRAFTIWGRDDTGVIDAIPKAKAEKMYEIIRAKVKEIKERKDAPSVVQQQQQQSPLDLLKTKFVNGEISAEEYEVKKKILEGQALAGMQSPKVLEIIKNIPDDGIGQTMTIRKKYIRKTSQSSRPTRPWCTV